MLVFGIRTFSFSNFRPFHFSKFPLRLTQTEHSHSVTSLPLNSCFLRILSNIPSLWNLHLLNAPHFLRSKSILFIPEFFHFAKHIRFFKYWYIFINISTFFCVINKNMILSFRELFILGFYWIYHFLLIYSAIICLQLLRF